MTFEDKESEMSHFNSHYFNGDPELGICDGSCEHCQEVRADMEQPEPAKRTGDGSRYVQVSREAMISALEKAGFKPFRDGGYGPSAELVYYRMHNRDGNVLIKIYTSLPANRSVARGCGEDAIRVVAVYEREDKNFPICKMPRVHRTGSEAAVIERTLERARDAWRFCNVWLRTPYAERKHLPRPGEKDEAREARVTRAQTRSTSAQQTRQPAREPGSDDDYEAECDSRAAADFEERAYGRD